MSAKANIPQRQTFLGGIKAAPGTVITKKDIVENDGGEYNEEYKQVAQDGVRGTLLPSNTGDTGGSVGFDPHAKMKRTVFDMESGDHFEVDPDKLIKAAKAIENPVGEKEQFKSKDRRRQLHNQMKELTQMSEDMTIEEPMAAPETPVAAALNAMPGVAYPLPPMPDAKMATKRIIFDLGGVAGQMETYYHEIILDGRCLVLVWDTRCKGQRYRPGVAPKIPLRVYVGSRREEYTVRSAGIQFELPSHGLDLTVLIVDNGIQDRPGPTEPGGISHDGKVQHL